MLRILRRLALIPHHRVRWALIILIGLVATVLAFHDRGVHASYATYDRMIAKRVWAQGADAKILIVDIDEASLDKMKREFGRWPWPRETLAGALEWLEFQQVGAVVFDILFADPDSLNPASDEAFADSVSRSKRSYFPVLRLNPINDAISEVRADQLPGFVQGTADRRPPKIAVVAPYFKSIIDSTRLGYHNVFPDLDGLARHYDYWTEKDGWRLLSLPARLARDFGWPLPDTPRHLIRFPAKANAYASVPFHEVWQLSQTSEGRKPDPRFQGAIVLIGSTASSLFDLKATPLSPIHPGVHLLANAIDNLKHANYLRELSWGLYLGITWLALILMGWASSFMRESTLNLSVLLIPGLMLVISFASLHIGSWFVDLSASASHALSFFSLMSVYQRLRVRHFADLETSARIVRDRDPARDLYQACLVMSYPQGRADAQRLINAAAGANAACAVVQMSWLGEPAEAQACPAVVQITADSEEGVRASAQAIIERESGYAAQSHLAGLRSISASAAKSACYSAEEIWQCVAQAIASWGQAATVTPGKME